MIRTYRARGRAALSVGEAEGSTWVEVFVLIVILGLLLLMWMPKGSRESAPAIHCLNNTRQVTLGWLQYPGDNNDRLPTTEPVAGVLDWTRSTDNTNRAILVNRDYSALAKYVPNPHVWKCPADKTKASNGQRVRSLSMNGAVTGSAVKVEGEWPNGRIFVPQVATMSEIQNPAEMFVVIDEHPDSINDSLFMVDPGANPQDTAYGWRDLPASFHKDGGAGVSFADGHSEIHKWEEKGTRQRIRKKNKPWGANGLSAPGSEDVQWMFDKMPYLEPEHPATSATP